MQPCYINITIITKTTVKYSAFFFRSGYDRTVQSWHFLFLLLLLLLSIIVCLHSYSKQKPVKITLLLPVTKKDSLAQDKQRGRRYAYFGSRPAHLCCPAQCPAQMPIYIMKKDIMVSISAFSIKEYLIG